MTIDIRAISAPDLSIDNEVINLKSLSLPGGKAVAGVGWVVMGFSAHEALLSVLKFVYGLISKKLPDHKVWLLVGSNVWQPDTRIIRYRKLWGALAARGIKVSHSHNTQEVMLEGVGELKFFGATQLSELSVGSVAKVLLEERCTYLAILPSSIELKNILNIGWCGGFAEKDSQFLASLIESGGLFIKRYGAYDDNEKGVVAIGQPELVKLLIS